MAIIYYFSKPNFFIIFTANLCWPKITDNLLRGQQAIDYLDLLCQVFMLKVKELITDLWNHIFRLYAGYIYIIEY
jgi:hypothetical protein